MRLGAALLSAAALVGCAGTDPAPAETAAADAGIVLELLQQRGDVAEGFVELRVTNGSASVLEVRRATYDSTAWSTQLVRDDPASIPAGARRNLRMQLPEPTCDEAPIDHRATLELVDGTVLVGEPGDPHGQLAGLDDAVCALRAFEADVARLTWLEPSIPAGGSAPATLRLQVTPVDGAAGDAVLGSVDAVDATVLLAIEADGVRAEQRAVGLDIVAGAAASVVELPLRPGRCDLHAIAEDKQGTIFRVRATAAGTPVELMLVSPEAQRDALLSWAVARCAVLEP